MADLNRIIEQVQDFYDNDMDLDRIGVWPVPAKIFGCVLAAAVILIACHFLIVSDKSDQLQRAKSEELELRASFEKKAFEARNLDRYREQMQEMSGTLDALVSRLPERIEMPDLLDDLEEKAIESRLEIEAINPDKEIPKEVYLEMPITIKVSGGYHEFGAFVSGIAGMPRIVTLRDFTITRAGGSDGVLDMQILAKTYRYKPLEE